MVMCLGKEHTTAASTSYHIIVEAGGLSPRRESPERFTGFQLYFFKDG